VTTVGLIIVASQGCSSWKTVVPETLELPEARMSSDSVAMEITFIRIPAGETDMCGQVWRSVDEQLLTPARRSHLNENGFRCGLVGLQLPVGLRTLLDAEQRTSALQEATPSDIDVLKQNRRIQCRSGRRSEIVTCTTREEMVVLRKDHDSQKVSGQTLRDAQCVLAARCYPEGNGEVRIELTPEIHHGTPRKQWVAGEGTFHLVTGRDREVFDDLLMEATLTPGQTLVLSCMPEFGLGHNFFLDTSNGDAQQKLLLIRLAQTQRDDLFEPVPVPDMDSSRPPSKIAL
jgi:hypothetical protein